MHMNVWEGEKRWDNTTRFKCDFLNVYKIKFAVIYR